MALFVGEGARRTGVRQIVRAGRDCLVAFCVVDDHVHVVVLVEPGRAPHLARGILHALRAVTNADVEIAQIKPIESRNHTRNTVLYLLRQVSKHGLAEHPALWSGSSFQDLAGARCLQWQSRLADALPRFRVREAYEESGLPPVELEPVDDLTLRIVGASRIAGAAASATAASPELRGRAFPEMAARRATVALGRHADIGTEELAFALATTPSTIRRLSTSAPDLALLRAVRMRLALELAVQRPPIMPMGGTARLDEA